MIAVTVFHLVAAILPCAVREAPGNCCEDLLDIRVRCVGMW